MLFRSTQIKNPNQESQQGPLTHDSVLLSSLSEDYRTGFNPAIRAETSRLQVFSQELDASDGVEQLRALHRSQEDLWFSGSGQASHGVRHLWKQVPVDRCRGLLPSIRVNRERAYARRVQ